MPNYIYKSLLFYSFIFQVTVRAVLRLNQNRDVILVCSRVLCLPILQDINNIKANWPCGDNCEKNFKDAAFTIQLNICWKNAGTKQVGFLGIFSANSWCII